tara:strand:- start:521 stop:739 length:219 start_codon:yes stop_codon:yes gene_type:complete
MKNAKAVLEGKYSALDVSNDSSITNVLLAEIVTALTEHTRIHNAEVSDAIKGLSYTLQNIQDQLSRYQTGRH